MLEHIRQAPAQPRLYVVIHNIDGPGAAPVPPAAALSLCLLAKPRPASHRNLKQRCLSGPAAPATSWVRLLLAPVRATSPDQRLLPQHPD